jgi:transcriptional repressor NrdR
MVVKKDGRRESFDRKKLRAGLVKACEKRPVSPAQLDAIVDSLETLLHDTEEREMATSDLGARVMDHLRDLDKVAYVRFASVYRKFEDVDEFLLELKNLLGRADAKATP